MILSLTYELAEICVQQGVTQAIVCPGSRCAPLTLAFARHPKVTTRTISDERSAAFIALGIAQQTKSPVVLICTSGSAAYNFAPAIAEAFFQHIPLLILTADRPPEWIDQLDGQTIRQANLYGTHVKRFFQFPVDWGNKDSQWHANRLMNEAIIQSQQFPAGPVHLNLPFREPFYPKGENPAFKSDVRIIKSKPASARMDQSLIEKFADRLSKFSKVLIMAGQDDYQESLIKVVDRFCKNHYAALIGDVISNFHSAESAVRHADTFLGQCPSDVKASLQPELLITFGKSIISKNTKQFLRNFPAQEHWHIQPADTAADTFQHLTEIIHTSPYQFFKELTSVAVEKGFNQQKKDNYSKLWEAEEHRYELHASEFFQNDSWNELSVVEKVIRALPPRCNLHLANSMSVRYANMIGMEASRKGIHVFCNRGTSGIDGSTSTAVGHALVSDVPNFLITGDMAFFYDRNAFWNNYQYPNLHVLVLNNRGGIIFNMIDGPSQQPELEEYFITRQPLSAESLAREFNLHFDRVDSPKKWKNTLPSFMSSEGKTKILEVICDPAMSKQQFENYKQQIRKGYES